MKYRQILIVVLVIAAFVLPSTALAGDRNKRHRNDDKNWAEKRVDRHQDHARSIGHTLGHLLRNMNVSFTYVQTGSNGGYWVPGQYQVPTGYGWTPHYYGNDGLLIRSAGVTSVIPQRAPMYWYQNGTEEWYLMDPPMRRKVENRALIEARKGLPYYFQGQQILPPGYMIQPGYGAQGGINIIVVRASESDEDDDEDREEEYSDDEDEDRPTRRSSEDGQPRIRRAR